MGHNNTSTRLLHHHQINNFYTLNFPQLVKMSSDSYIAMLEVSTVYIVVVLSTTSWLLVYHKLAWFDFCLVVLQSSAFNLALLLKFLSILNPAPLPLRELANNFI